MELLILLVLLGGFVAVATVRQRKRREELEAERATELAAVKRAADEDVTRFGEELQRLDIDVTGSGFGEPVRQDYQRALDSYEQAKQSLDAVRRNEEIRHVTEVLEDGRYAIACVRSRLAGEPLPQRRPPCFFNPAHGPSTIDVSWAPPGGEQRDVPVCPADAERVAAGAEPDIRTVMNGPQRVPYWQGGPAYSPWAQGYFGSYAASGLVPAFLLGSMMMGPGLGWGGGFDQGYDEGFDAGQDSGGGDAGGDGGGDAGGDGGGFFDGGGFDGGGFDGGF
jgi:hypothetical protein